MLTAVDRGLGAHLRTGAVLEDPAARAAIGVRDGERVVALVSVGEPAELPQLKSRVNPDSLTVWAD
jgi:hypothetical protein